LTGCDLPSVFSDPVTKVADDFICETAESSTPSTTGPTESVIYVYVVGEVRNPGVYRVERTDRLEAVIEAAGGFTEDAEPASVNLARTVSDGEQVVVLSREAYQTASALLDVDGILSRPVNINTATERELMALPGIGQTRAQAIIDHRNKHGPFDTIEDIMRVSGIKQAAFEQIRENITTGN